MQHGVNLKNETIAERLETTPKWYFVLLWASWMQHAQQPTWLSHIVLSWMFAVQINIPYIADCIQNSVGLGLCGSCNFSPNSHGDGAELVLQQEQALSPTQWQCEAEEHHKGEPPGHQVCIREQIQHISGHLWINPSLYVSPGSCCTNIIQ